MILETFAFLFSTQGTEKVQKDVKDLKRDTDKVVEGNNALKQSFEEILGVIAPLTAAYTTLRGFMDFADGKDQLFQLSQLSDLSARSIAELGFAMGEFGGNAQTAAHMIQNLQQQITTLRTTGGGALLQANMIYGVGISTDPVKMMENIARRMESLTAAQRMDLGRMLGLDNATILLLSKGVKNLREEMERAKKYTFIDDKTVEQAHEFNRTFEEFSALFASIGTSIATTILPYATDLVALGRDALAYLKEHKFLMLEIAGIVAAMSASLVNWKGIFGALLSPAGQIAAALLAAAVVIEDIYGYFNGMDSFIGDLAAKSPELKNALDSIGESVKNMWSYISSGDMYNDLKQSWDDFVKWWNDTPLEAKEGQIYAALSESLKTSKEKLIEYKDDINALWRQFVEENKDTLDELANYFKNDFWTDVGKVLGETKNFFVDIKDVIEGETGLISACEKMVDSLKNITAQEFFQTITDFIDIVSNWLGDTWDYLKNAGREISRGYESTQTQTPISQTFSAMNTWAANEQATAQSRNALHQLMQVSNNNQRTNLNADVTINVQEGTRQTGVDVSNGLLDTLGVYANGTR